jgi:hypothetical protein
VSPELESNLLPRLSAFLVAILKEPDNNYVLEPRAAIRHLQVSGVSGRSRRQYLSSSQQFSLEELIDELIDNHQIGRDNLIG